MEEIHRAEIKNADGIEIRAGIQVVDYANQLYNEYERKIDFALRVGGNTIDPCSIMQISMLGLTYGSKVEVIATAENDSGIKKTDLENAAKKLAAQLERDDFKEDINNNL